MTAPITCTWDEAKALDDTEALLIAGWADALRHGQTPRFVAALIEHACSFEPRLGLHMDNCTRHGCSVLVDERARDEHGLFCSDACADAHAEDLHEATVAWGLANGYVRPTHPNGRAA